MKTHIVRIRSRGVTPGDDEVLERNLGAVIYDEAPHGIISIDLEMLAINHHTCDAADANRD